MLPSHLHYQLNHSLFIFIRIYHVYLCFYIYVNRNLSFLPIYFIKKLYTFHFYHKSSWTFLLCFLYYKPVFTHFLSDLKHHQRFSFFPLPALVRDSNFYKDKIRQFGKLSYLLWVKWFTLTPENFGHKSCL